ncbi:hypothetical protein HDU97_008795 [Phlyctochytrium planicorne]|nr:hypothetical protein HDU97_008795 [Phlyctochytrium planicorne]
MIASSITLMIALVASSVSSFPTNQNDHRVAATIPQSTNHTSASIDSNIILGARSNFGSCANVAFSNSQPDVDDGRTKFWSNGNYIFDSIWGCYWYALDHGDECSTHVFKDGVSGRDATIEVCFSGHPEQKFNLKDMGAARCFVGQATDFFMHQAAYGRMRWGEPSQDVEIIIYD